MDHYRTWLFAPADVPDRCLKALHSAADQVIWDLEDAVAPARKEMARQTIIRLESRVTTDRVPWVRVNDLGDLAVLAPQWPHQRWVVPQMDQSRFDQLSALLEPTPFPREWLFLIESARGLWDLIHSNRPWNLAGDSIRLGFGALDYLNDLDASMTPEEWALWGPRTLLPWVSRAWDWPSPIDTVFPYLEDDAGLVLSTQRARALGFQGRLIIHPQQITTVHGVFSPSEAERQWAMQIVTQAQGQGAVRVGGEMVDHPVLQRAQRILDKIATHTDAKEGTE
jgi:citrate lyase subunit beta/citryl-CoA lyase